MKLTKSNVKIYKTFLSKLLTDNVLIENEHDLLIKEKLVRHNRIIQTIKEYLDELAFITDNMIYLTEFDEFEDYKDEINKWGGNKNFYKAALIPTRKQFLNSISQD